MTIKKCRKATYFCILFSIVLLALSLITACNGRKDEDKDADYYLSLASTGWQTYDTNTMIPDAVHFTSSGNDVYTLKIDLDEGEKFTVNQVGSANKIGFDKLFTAADDLANGENGSIKVAHSGAFVLSYNSVDDTLTYNYTALPVSVEITTTTTSLHTGDKYPYKATVTYSNGDSKEEEVAWESSNEAVISVDADGMVSALSAGSATLTASAYGFSDTLDITVEPSSVPVTGVQLDKTELSMELNSEYKLSATVLPENADSKLVSWSTSNGSVVTVSQDGTLKAVNYGTAVITVTTAQNGCTDECTVTVVKHVSAMRFVSEELTVVAGGKTKTLELVFSPSDATNKDVEVEVTSGNQYAEVEKTEEGFLLRGLAEGTATVTATLKENREITATCSITVLAAGSELASMEQDVRVMIGNNYQLEVTLEKGSIGTVEWTVEDATVASLTSEGATATVTGVDFGSTIVTAKVQAEDGTEYTATCNLLVADEWYFIYGYNLGKSDWDYADYVSDKNEAQLDELLFTEQSKGIYTLTRHLTPDNGFQIIFPQVANYTEHDDLTDDDVWNKNIPSHWVNSSHYYRAERSDSQYVKNSAEYFCVNAAGVYTVTLDLTGKSAVVYIKMVSLDVTAVQLELVEGAYILNNGETAKVEFSVLPANAAYTEKDASYSLTSDYVDYAKYLSCTLDYADGTLALSVGAAPQSFTVVLHFTVSGIEQELEFYVLSQNTNKVAATTIAFEKEKYEFNVNNGSGNWTTIVKANVNADATNQQVRYYDVTDYSMLLSHAADERAIVDSVTGEVTARSLGTLKIKAVSLDDDSVSTVVEVLFYSDQIYIVGAGVYGGWTELSQNETTTQGTSRANYTFTKVSNSKYTYHFESAKTGETNKFKIVFLGMDTAWTGQINTTNVIESLSNVRWGWDSGCDVASGDSYNFVIRLGKDYTFTIDLSMHKPVVLIDRSDLDVAEDYVLEFNGETDLKLNDTATARFLTVPFERFESEQIQVTYQGNEDRLLSHVYDSDTNSIKFTVQKQEHAEDKSITVTIKLKNTTKTLTFNILAEHHLELTWDDDNHWYCCTDDNCSYFEDSEGVAGKKTKHDQQSAWSANAEGHYYACSGCGAEFGLVEHVYELRDGVFDFSSDMEKCSVCQFSLFTIEQGTLKSYYGHAEKVTVPDSVTVLGAHVFDGHTELKEITLPNKLETIGDYAFADCINLATIRIGNYVTRIGQYAFKGTAVKFTWGKALRLKSLGDHSLAGWLGASFTIPDAIETVAGFAFNDAINLKKIVIPKTVTNYSFAEVFNGCTSLTYVDLAASRVTQVSGFAGCTALETVIIRSLNFWEFFADSFKGCTALKAVYLARPLSELLTCNWLFMNGEGVATGAASNRDLKGKVFAFSESDPGSDPCGNAYSNYFGYFRDWFGGYWHWDGSGEQEVENIQLWETDESAVTPANMPAILNDNKSLFA